MAAHPPDGGAHQTPLSEHLIDAWEVAKVALRESLVILIIAGTSVGLELLLQWLGKLPGGGKAGDEAFVRFFFVVKIAAYITFGSIMIISLATDVLKAVRRFVQEWRRRH